MDQGLVHRRLQLLSTTIQKVPQGAPRCRLLLALTSPPLPDQLTAGLVPRVSEHRHTVGSHALAPSTVLRLTVLSPRCPSRFRRPSSEIGFYGEQALARVTGDVGKSVLEPNHWLSKVMSTPQRPRQEGATRPSVVSSVPLEG